MAQEGLVDILETCDDEDAALSTFVNDFFDQSKDGDDRNAYNKLIRNMFNNFCR